MKKVKQQNIDTTYGSYFDYAAATPMSKTVLAVMKPYFSETFYNPSAQYLSAQNVRKSIESARSEVALILGTSPSEIIFTAGGTEANNLAIRGIMANNPDANCVVSAIEHDSVLKSASLYDCRIAPVDKHGRIDLARLKKLIDEKTVLVSIMYANNEIGTVQPLAGISKILSEIKWQRTKKGNSLPLYFHTDACQAPSYLHLLVHTLGVDMMTLNGGKIYGPKQSGVLYVERDIKLKPLVYGGGQEKGLRSGTENVPGIIGFAAALKETVALREIEVARLQKLQQMAWIHIVENIPKAVITGIGTQQLANNLHVRFPGVDNERLMMELDEKGFMVAVGSACSASSDVPSHVLKAIGLSDEDARSSLRITFGRHTNRQDLDKLLKHLKSLLG